ncbi:MAG: hypothetical protein R3C12_16580 [Planctomycetaceae bacterium]
MQRFVEAIRQREQPRAPFEAGLLSTRLCHLGNLAYRQGAEWREESSISRETLG